LLSSVFLGLVGYGFGYGYGCGFTAKKPETEIKTAPLRMSFFCKKMVGRLNKFQHFYGIWGCFLA
jgi:hypothetical protein